MKGKLENILMKNNLYKDGNELFINKKKDFLSTYKYNDSNNHPFPNTIIRDNNGNILLDEVPFVISGIKEYGMNKPDYILLNNGSKILRKKVSDETIYNEIIIMYLLRELEVPSANYDSAIINGKKYLVSNSFLENNETIDIAFTNYYNSVIHMTEIAIKYGIKDFYLKTLFADKIYGNYDREFNFGMIQNNKKSTYKPTPLFDNGESILKRDIPYFDTPYINSNYDMDIIINHLLGYEEIMYWALNTVTKVNLNKAAKTMEKEKKIHIPNDIYEKLENYFKDSEDIINDEIKKKGKSFKINLT